MPAFILYELTGYFTAEILWLHDCNVCVLVITCLGGMLLVYSPMPRAVAPEGEGGIYNILARHVIIDLLPV